MVKSVERVRTKKTIKKNDDGEIVNEIIININNPPPEKENQQEKQQEKQQKEEKEKKKKAKRRKIGRMKKLKAIKKLKEDLDKFKKLKDIAKSKNIPLPSKLGESPDNIDDINSIKEIENLTKDIENRNLEIEGIIERDTTGSQLMGTNTPQSLSLMSGVFSNIPQPNITPSGGGGRFTPAITPPTTNQSINLLSTQWVEIKKEWNEIQAELGGLTNIRQVKTYLDGLNNNEVSQLMTKTDKLYKLMIEWKQKYETIYPQLDPTSKLLFNEIYNPTTNQGQFIVEFNPVEQLDATLKNYIQNKGGDIPPDSPPDSPNIQPVEPPQKPDDNQDDNLEKTLDQLRDDLVNEYTKEGKKIPGNIQDLAEKKFEEQQEERLKNITIPDDIQTDLNYLKPNSPEDFYNNFVNQIKEMINNPTRDNLTTLKSMTENNIPEQVDLKELKFIYGKVIKQFPPPKRKPGRPKKKPDQPPQQPDQPPQQPDQPPQQPDQPPQQPKKNLKPAKQTKEIIKLYLGILSRGETLPDEILEKNQLKQLSNINETELIGRTTPIEWYNYWANYTNFTKSVKDSILEFEGGIYQVNKTNADKLETSKKQLLTEYENYKNSLTPLQEGTIQLNPVNKYDNAITTGLEKPLLEIVKLILQQDGKPTNNITIGDVELTTQLSATKERFMPGGDYDNILSRLAKQYRGTIDITQLNQVNDQLRQEQLQADRLFRDTGAGEILIKNQYDDFINKIKDLQKKIADKIEAVNNPPTYKYQMFDALQPGEKIPVEKGYLAKTLEGKPIYNGINPVDVIAQAEQRQKDEGGTLPPGFKDITGDNP
jgi:hypothetical protein